MAIINDNSFLYGCSGKSGNYIFYQRNGKTVMARVPRYKSERTEAQLTDQELFRQAIAFAKQMMIDPVKKEEYRQKARKWKIDSAFRAAVSEFMRKNKL